MKCDDNYYLKNNNNNENNNNNQNVNEGTTDTMQNNMGMVVVPPLPPGRMLNISLDQYYHRNKRGLMDNIPPCLALVMVSLTEMFRSWPRGEG